MNDIVCVKENRLTHEGKDEVRDEYKTVQLTEYRTAHLITSPTCKHTVCTHTVHTHTLKSFERENIQSTSFHSCVVTLAVTRFCV